MKLPSFSIVAFLECYDLCLRTLGVIQQSVNSGVVCQILGSVDWFWAEKGEKKTKLLQLIDEH